ncbi:MAG: glycosyltransferase family 2 protein [Candidatus Omnitrophota bacterium]
MPKCDIIIPVWNQPRITARCLESVTANTLCDYGVIVIDNASGRETVRVLDRFKAEVTGRPFSIIRNAENIGFVKAVNEGIHASRAQYICILNNDTVTAKGWLTEMLAVADRNPSIGVLNPSSNNLGQKKPFLMAFKEYASGVARNSGKYVEMMSCVGFCMLFRRSLTDEIGMFDEMYGMGNFEDTDFCMRARERGYLCARALGAYVYHRENTSFRMIKKHHYDFEKNRVLFESRWGRPRRVFFAVNGAVSLKEIALRVDEEIKKGNWVFVLSGQGDIAGMLGNRSGLKVYRRGPLFHSLRALIKIITKKKKFDIVYTDSKFLTAAAGGLGLSKRAEWRAL